MNQMLKSEQDQEKVLEGEKLTWFSKFHKEIETNAE